MSGPPERVFALDELEHQALDTLDADPDGDPDETERAIETARPMFARLVATLADRLLVAAKALASTDQRGPLDPDAIASVHAQIQANPQLALAVSSAVEAVGGSLGLDRDGLAWSTLIELGERTQADADPTLQTCAAAIADRLQAAQPRDGAIVPVPLRIFRSAAVTAAGPEIRAQFLAADHPEHLALARALVEVVDDPALLVDRFDAARTTLASEAPSKPAEPVTDGPKRKFTIVHAILALIILALTVWHYALR